jgi:hypothetical protein
LTKSSFFGAQLREKQNKNANHQTKKKKDEKTRKKKGRKQQRIAKEKKIHSIKGF